MLTSREPAGGPAAAPEAATHGTTGPGPATGLQTPGMGILAVPPSPSRQWLQDIARMLRGNGYTSPVPLPAEYLLQHGRQFTVRARRRSHGVPKACYANSYRLAQRSRGLLQYVEGYASAPSVGLPLEHAWCVDREGRVVDPTWRDDGAEPDYFGVPVSLEAVRRIMRLTGCYGVFGGYRWDRVHAVLLEHL